MEGKSTLQIKPEYQILLDRNEKLMALATMTEATYQVIYGAKKGTNWNGIILFNTVMVNLEYNAVTKTYQYNTTYDRAQTNVDTTTMEVYYTTLSPVEVMITSNIISKPHSLSGQMYLEARAKLAAERDALQDKLLRDLVVGGGSVALSAINPLAGAGVALVKVLAENNRADAAVAFNNGGKSILYDSKDPGSIGAAGVITNTTKAFINYNANYSKITAVMNQEDKKMLQVGFIKAGYIT